jgi:hypothetical protein
MNLLIWVEWIQKYKWGWSQDSRLDLCEILVKVGKGCVEQSSNSIMQGCQMSQIFYRIPCLLECGVFRNM